VCKNYGGIILKTFKVWGKAKIEADNIKSAYHQLGAFYLGLADKCYGLEKPFKEGHLYMAEEKKDATSRR
jgi:hypothetical protein